MARFDIVRTKTQWRAQGRGLKKNAVATFVKNNKFGSVNYYNEEQTVAHKPYTVARNYLVDMFVGWPDRFGYTESSTEKIVTVRTSSIRSSAIRSCTTINQSKRH